MAEEFQISYEPGEKLKLFRHDEHMGTITELDSNYPNIIGTLVLEPAASAYKPIWEFLQKPDASEGEPPFDYNAVKDGWCVENDLNQRRAIFFPGVRAGAIMFRFNRG